MKCVCQNTRLNYHKLSHKRAKQVNILSLTQLLSVSFTLLTQYRMPVFLISLCLLNDWTFLGISTSITLKHTDTCTHPLIYTLNQFDFIHLLYRNLTMYKQNVSPRQRLIHSCMVHSKPAQLLSNVCFPAPLNAPNLTVSPHCQTNTHQFMKLVSSCASNRTKKIMFALFLKHCIFDFWNNLSSNHRFENLTSEFITCCAILQVNRLEFH